MLHKRFFSSLSFRLQSIAIFLSLVGLGFGYKTYEHVKRDFGVQAAATFYHDFLLQIAIALVVNVLVAVALYFITTRPIKTLGEVMRAITENKLDIEVPYTKQTTEIGSMARKVEIFKKNAIEKKKLEQDQEAQQQRMAEEKKRATHELANRFEREVQNILEEVIHEVEHVRTLSDRMAAVIDGTSKKAIVVAGTVDSTTHNVSNVAGAAEEMSVTANEVAQQINQSAQAVKLVVEANDSANQVAGTLENAMAKIDEIVTMIQNIAGQINLLALNATIESARAGEAGKGFAVVASEVKGLAGQTARATEEISTQIEGIQTITRQVMGALTSINESVSRVDNASSSISASIQQQTAATSEIARNISHVAGSAQQILSDIEGVKKDTLDATSCARESLTAITSLQSSSNRLSQAVSNFLSEVRAA